MPHKGKVRAQFYGENPEQADRKKKHIIVLFSELVLSKPIFLWTSFSSLSFQANTLLDQRIDQEDASIPPYSLRQPGFLFIDSFLSPDQNESTFLFLERTQKTKDEISTSQTNNTFAPRRIVGQCRRYGILYDSRLENTAYEKVSIIR